MGTPSFPLRCSALSYLSLAVLLATIGGCSLDRHRTTANYVESGNAEFARGMYVQALSRYEKAVNTDPMYGEAYYRAGITALKLQRWSDAARYLQRAIGLQPERLEAYTELANLYLFAYGASNQTARAPILQELQYVSERLRARFPGGYDDLRLKGYLALFANDRDTALVNFQKANGIKPNQPDLLPAYVETLVSAGHVAAAEMLVKDAASNDPATSKLYEALVSHYLRANRPVDVERILRLEVHNSPSLPDGYLELAAYYFSARRWPEAAKLLGELGDDTARFPAGPLLAGDFYLRVRDLAHAQELYQRGINQGGPAKRVYQKRMVEVLVKQNSVGQAQQLIQQVLKGNSTDPEALAIQASLKVLSGDTKQFQSAISAFRPLLGPLPDDFVLRYLYGRALLLTGDAGAAVLQFKDAIRLRPDYLWPRVALAHLTLDAREYGSMLLLLRGVAADEGVNVPYDTAGQRPQERPFYESILAIKPSSAVALSGLAAKVAETDFGADEAFALAQRARQQLPNDDDLAATLALLYIKRNLPDTAIGLLTPLVQRDPARVMYRYRMAMAFLEKGDKSKARQECEAALLCPATTDEKKNIRQLMSKLG